MLAAVGLALLVSGGAARWLLSSSAGGSRASTPVPVGHAGRAAPGGQAATAVPAAGLESSLYMVPVSSSQPAQGASDALVTIVQWCNLPDAACARFEPKLQALLARHAAETRLVFRHYLADPNDTSSLHAHHFARGAYELGGKFWEARALLLEPKGPVTFAVLEAYANQLGLDWSVLRSGIEQGRYGGMVTGDRLFGEMFEVAATPTFFVNGRPVREPSAEALEALVVEELAHARSLVASGVSKDQLYAELVKKGTWVRPARRKP